MEKAVVNYNLTDVAIREMSDLYMDLCVANTKDKGELAAVHNARMVVKSHRIAVEKKRKELKADALEWGNVVDGEARRIQGLIKPIETHLEAEENKVKEEQGRIKREEEERVRNQVQERVDGLLSWNCVVPFIEAATMTADEYSQVLNAAKEKYESAKKIEAEAEEKRKEEAALLEKQRVEQEETAAKLRAEADRLEAEEARRRKEAEAERQEIERDRQKIESDRKSIQDAEDKKRMEADAREVAERELIEKQKKEEFEKEKLELAEKREAERLYALKPDKVKLREAVSRLTIQPLALDNVAASDLLAVIRVDLETFLIAMFAKIEEL